ncbi:MAG: RsmB/NOP family class I SAM-dependent RNA methyltransferase [Clostridia bacterium]|nr:RsmB/NOP family class I SAM-dependent RNA methyltransferase [Clostridia bacterium]
MIELPAEFLKRAKAELGGEYADFLNSYNNPSVRGIRVNTLKISAEEFERLAPVPLDGKVEWEPNGFYTPSETPGKTIFHAAGLYYVQEPSAMCAAPELEVKRGERVLDLCSAPGGKGTQLAQAMQGEGVLVLNEIVPKRAEILRSNVERLGVKNALITSTEPKRLAEVFKNYFDKILVDAPCSGEGMFKKEEAAIPEWSVQNVALCAERQKEILDCAADMLSGGGRLVYSTCTFAPEEDEGQVERFLQAHTEFKLLSQKKLLPHKVRGEGHFCAVLEKTGGERRDISVIRPTVPDKKLLKVFEEWQRDTLLKKAENLVLRNYSFYSVADGTPDLSSTKIPHNFGVYLGKVSDDGKRFEPSHTLAMSLNRSEVKCVEVDEKTATAYLRGLTFDCEEKGWRVVTHKGFPLGWCKASGGLAKNHLPKGLRI